MSEEAKMIDDGVPPASIEASLQLLSHEVRNSALEAAAELLEYKIAENEKATNSARIAFGPEAYDAYDDINAVLRELARQIRSLKAARTTQTQRK